MSTNTMAINGAYVWELRLAKKLIRDVLAGSARMSVKQLWRLETGRTRRATRRVLKGLAAALEVPEESLLMPAAPPARAISPIVPVSVKFTSWRDESGFESGFSATLRFSKQEKQSDAVMAAFRAIEAEEAAFDAVTAAFRAIAEKKAAFDAVMAGFRAIEAEKTEGRDHDHKNQEVDRQSSANPETARSPVCAPSWNRPRNRPLITVKPLDSRRMPDLSRVPHPYKPFVI